MLFALAMAVYEPSFDPYGSAIGIRRASEIQPIVGQDATATIGDRLVWTETYRLAEGAVSIGDAPFSIQATSKTLPSGSELYRINSTRPFKACTVIATTGEDHACFIDDDGNGTFDRVSKDFFDAARPLAEKISYTRKASIRLPAATSGFVREIRYQGATPDTLHLRYREFSDDLARPAFTEDLSVPLGNRFPQSVALKGMILKIKDIGPMGITYSVDQVRADSGWNYIPAN